jgi:hypothetical protein
MDVQEKLEKGHIHARTILEVVGTPKEHVEASIRTYIEQIKKPEEMEVLKEDIADAAEKDDGTWVTFAELEILFADITALTQFCFIFMPSSIEILAPEKISLENRDLSAVMNDLQAKLHILHATAESLRRQGEVYKTSIHTIMQNFISILLYNSGKTKTQLSKLTGLSEENLNIVLEGMAKKGQIKKEGDAYILVKNERKEQG